MEPAQNELFPNFIVHFQNVNQDKFSLMGWSDGGITAMMLAAMIPDKIRKMVVWGANSYVTPEELATYEKIRNVDQWSGMMRKPFEDVYGFEYFSEQFANWVDAFAKYGQNREGWW
jgi:valacyclovir hydrolase